MFWRRQFNPWVSLLVAVLVAAVVDGVIWLTRSGGGSARTDLPAVRTPNSDSIQQSGHELLVGVGSNVAYFIMWTRTGDQLGGDMTEDLIAPGPGGTFTDTFSGTVRGRRVKLSLPGQGLDNQGSFSGHLNGNTLVVDAPGQPHGVIRFHVEKDLKLYARSVNAMEARQNAKVGGG